MVERNAKVIAEQFKPIDLPPLSDKPLVSVLMANYNYAKYVGEAIESVLCQTYESFEVVVCDDGSTDNSREVIAKYAERDPRVRLVAKENGGIGSALNAAYAASQGEIICLLDADDVFLPEKLARVVEALRRAPQCGACLHRIIKMYPDGRTFGCPVPVVFVEGWMGPEALRGGGIPKTLPSKSIPEASGMSFRRVVTEAIFPVPSRIRIMADGYVCYAAQFVSEFCAVPEVLAKLRVHGHNTNGSAEYTLGNVTRNVEGLSQFVGEVREFLAVRYGEPVARELRIEDNSIYCSGRLLLYILADQGSRKKTMPPPEEWVRGVHPRRQRILIRTLLALPAPLSRRALLLWKGLSPVDASILRFTRFLLRI